MLEHDEENEHEAEVRREDQENINKFGRLNARLHECRTEFAVLKVRIGLICMDWLRLYCIALDCVLVVGCWLV